MAAATANNHEFTNKPSSFHLNLVSIKTSADFGPGSQIRVE